MDHKPKQHSEFLSDLDKPPKLRAVDSKSQLRTPWFGYLLTLPFPIFLAISTVASNKIRGVSVVTGGEEVRDIDRFWYSVSVFTGFACAFAFLPFGVGVLFIIGSKLQQRYERGRRDP